MRKQNDARDQAANLYVRLTSQINYNLLSADLFYGGKIENEERAASCLHNPADCVARELTREVSAIRRIFDQSARQPQHK
jgi:hypothetical protein